MELRLLSDARYAEESDVVADELIDRYVMGEIPADEVERFEEYFLRSQARRDKLGFALALKKRKAALGRAQKLYRLYLPAAAAAVIAVGLGVGLWRALIYQSDVDRGLAAFQSAYSRERPLDARLSALAYAPASRQRGAEQADSVQRDAARGFLARAVAERPSAESHHALGQFYLADRQFDRAVQQFKAALALDPRDARIHSDLGAALLEKGKLDDAAREGAGEFAESLEHLNEALRLDGSLAGALFNRALLHQEMGLLREAEDDWRNYLERETDARWADEARRRLALLEEEKRQTSRGEEVILEEFVRAHDAGDGEGAWRLVSSYHHRPGNVVVARLADALLEQSAAGRRDEAGRTSRLLAYAGELERERAGDRFYSDVARLYGSATPEQRAALAEARGLMREGHETWGRVKVDESLDLFGRARRLFERAGSVGEVKAAEYWMSFCHYRVGRQEQSLALLEPLVSFCEANGYAWLRVRCLYLRSALHFLVNEHSKAVDAARRAAELAERTNDLVGLLNVVSALVEYYRYLGNHQRMLGYIRRSLPLVRSIALNPVQGARHYGLVAIAFASIGRNAAAAAYQREALRLALDTKAPAVVSNNYAFLGMINGRLKNFDEAVRNARHAFDIAEARPGERDYLNLMAYSSLQMGHIQREAGRCDEALRSYGRAVEIYESDEDFQTHLYHAHKGKLLCHVARGDDAQAAEEIAKTLALVEKYRQRIHEENNRNAFFDVEQSVYDAAIDFAYSRQNDADQAFAYLESSRSRSLLDLLESDREVLDKVNDPEIVLRSVARPLTLSEIRRRMPGRAQVLQYAVLENKTLIWVISGDRPPAVVVAQVSQKELTEKVAGYVQAISRAPGPGGEEDARRLAAELSAVLLGPAAPLLDPGKVLCFIPDKVLHHLPFAALVSPASGRYLAEERAVLTSPSPTIFVLCSEAAARKEGARDERLLSVGNPRFDRRAYPALPDLPSAAREAEAAAAYYGDAPLTGDSASRAAVMSRMAGADVIHLALHSALDEEVPLRSKLLLAASPRESSAAPRAAAPPADPPAESALYAYDVYNLKLPQARLVVLSACQTGAERYYGGEGMSSLARPFIAAGVPLVVATLWPVDSDATAELMIRFHGYRARGKFPTAAALARAQTDLIRGPEERLRHPYYWAAFTLVGGHAAF